MAFAKVDECKSPRRIEVSTLSLFADAIYKPVGPVTANCHSKSSERLHDESTEDCCIRQLQEKAFQLYPKTEKIINIDLSWSNKGYAVSCIGERLERLHQK